MRSGAPEFMGLAENDSDDYYQIPARATPAANNWKRLMRCKLRWPLRVFRQVDASGRWRELVQFVG
jgi:hypothetical protein